MKIALISAAFQSRKGGVADHSRILKAALERHAEVRLFEEPAFSPFAISSVIRALMLAGCGHAVLQYAPNLYGWYNPFPWLLLRGLKRRKIICLTIFHEIFMPEYRGFIRNIVERPVNYFKDRLCLKSTQFSAVTFHRRALEIQEKISVKPRVLPVFSNIPLYQGDRQRVEYLIGTFGTGHHDTDIGGILQALQGFKNARALFIGDFDRRAIHSPLADVTGYLPADEVAKALGRMRYFVLFDKRGISMRKGSAAAAFLNGLPVVANRTEWTDPEFLDGENVCLFDGTVEGLAGALRRLEGDPALAGRVAAGGRALYDGRMACGVIARRIVDILQGRDS